MSASQTACYRALTSSSLQHFCWTQHTYTFIPVTAKVCMWWPHQNCCCHWCSAVVQSHVTAVSCNTHTHTLMHNMSKQRARPVPMSSIHTVRSHTHTAGWCYHSSANTNELHPSLTETQPDCRNFSSSVLLYELAISRISLWLREILDILLKTRSMEVYERISVFVSKEISVQHNPENSS